MIVLSQCKWISSSERRTIFNKLQQVCGCSSQAPQNCDRTPEMMAAKLQLSSTASLHAGFIFDQLFVNLSLPLSLSHTEQTLVETPLSIRLRRRSSFPDRCESFLNRAHPHSALVSCSTNKHLTVTLTHTHTHTLLSDFLPFVHVSLLRWTSRIVLLCWGFHRTGSSLRTLRIHRTQINCPEMFRKRATASQPAWNPQPRHGISGTTTESSGAGEHLTPPCRHEPVPPYTGGANSAEARGKNAPWGPSFYDFQLI